MKRIIFIVLISTASLAVSSAYGQTGPYYTGTLEYTLPLLTSVPPLTDSQPPDVVSAYLWADELMRTTKWNSINKWIGNLGYGDTMKYLAEMLYEVGNDNPLSLYQWEVSANPNSISQHLSWNYKGMPAVEIPELQNQIGTNFGDSGRTGFILACDIITDLIVSDTLLKYDSTDMITPHMVLANATINDEIKGKIIPGYPSTRAFRKGASPQSGWTVIPIPAIPTVAALGVPIRFEYSPEWASNVSDDQVPYPHQLQDTTGWWVKPGGEYIAFLRLAGTGSDTSYGYFSVQPFWGVFGTQGAMYKVVAGHVVDPNDDFGLGGTNLTVSDWKSRFRARIYNILHP